MSAPNCPNPSRTRYVNAKCRCDGCTAANLAYQTAWKRDYAKRTGRRILHGRVTAAPRERKARA